MAAHDLIFGDKPTRVTYYARHIPLARVAAAFPSFEVGYVLTSGEHLRYRPMPTHLLRRDISSLHLEVKGQLLTFDFDLRTKQLDAWGRATGPDIALCGRHGRERVCARCWQFATRRSADREPPRTWRKRPCSAAFDRSGR